MRLAAILLILCSGCAAGPPWQGQVQHLTIEIPGPSKFPWYTFGTFNLHGLRDVDGLRDDLWRQPVDVWAFQELAVESFDVSPALHEILPPGRWHVAAVVLNREHGAWEAQAIVSRWPMKQMGCWHHPRDDIKRRAALFAVLETPAGDVTFVNVDHAVSYFSAGDSNARQSKRLARALRQRSDRRLVVAGDFNTTGSLWRFKSNAAAVASLNRAMHEAMLTTLPGRTVADKTFRPANNQLDHLFYRGLQIRDWHSPRPRGSDHHPLIVQFAP